ncbi:MAG: tetratricopeptide repeat protein [Magnetospirillum gryphiswaldense]|nr:tetratricopeptide repeat protein [Magnetospirillum gryphiswaldense]
MTRMSPMQALSNAAALIQNGQLEQARGLLADYRFGDDAQSAEGLRLLAKLHLHFGDAAAALATLRRALTAAPDLADGGFELGVILLANQDWAGAADVFSQVLQAHPDDNRTRFNLAWALARAGRDEAEAVYRAVVDADPGHVDAWYNLGNLLARAGRTEAAGDCYGRALERAPARWDVLCNLAVCLIDLGRPKEAVSLLQRGLLQSGPPSLLSLLGCALRALGDEAGAETAFRDALRRDHGDSECRHNLALLLIESGRLDEAWRLLDSQDEDAAAINLRGVIELGRFRPYQAETLLRRSLALVPDIPHVISNLGKALALQGKAAEALVQFRRAHELVPTDAAVHSNLLFALCHDAVIDADSLAREHRRFGEIQEGLATPLTLPPARSSRGRRLRVGYVSPDFRDHAVMLLFTGVLERHDRSRFEIHCYFTGTRGDDTTRRVAALVDHFHEIGRDNADCAARRIRDDAIDVLVDLAGHSAGNGLPIFARRPAPLQITWLGYPGTTGLTRMDYRLGQGKPPPGELDPFGTERLVGVTPYPLFCPPAASPLPSPPPSVGGRGVVFGSLNRAGKINPAVAQVWARILRDTPGSRLLIVAESGEQEEVREHLLSLFAGQGIDRTRLDIRPALPLVGFLDLMAEVDVALDPFPYGGGTTTLLTLWMGVPVVSLGGSDLRQGTSATILVGIGVADLVAGDVDAYVGKACALVADTDGLIRLRSELRARLLLSSLMDAAAYTRAFEAVVTNLWERHVVAPSP